MEKLRKREQENLCWAWYSDASLQLIYEDFTAYVQAYINAKREWSES